MTADRWRQIEELFNQAVECPPKERQSFLDRACQGDDELRRELNSLLASDAPEQKLVEVPDALQAARLNGLDADFSGRRIGPYRLVSLIGTGGMGAVYLGVRDDDQYQKQVAIKLLKRGLDTALMVNLFRQERQILANLEHPFIARLLDGGATEDGLPYFVMEYVDGEPISEYCERNKLLIPERLRLFRLVCEAVQHAHQNLVVHRDLKPRNILTTKEGIPKLLDFGIAKALDPGVQEDGTLTQHGQRMLTPDYASPEQVKGLPISTASDIYSLGAILYELLSGQRPHRFPSGSITDLERTICEIEPEKPSAAVDRNTEMPPSVRSHLRRQLSGDLDHIVLAALRKEPQRRYGSASDLSEDLRRHMDGLPILVEEDRWSYRAGKFVRRHKLAVGAALLVGISLIGGIFATTFQTRRAERRFQEVRGLANFFLFSIYDQIEALPGATPVRESIVRTVLKYLNELARDAGDDPSLQWELATAYQKIGDVQGYGVRPNLGQRTAAIESHNKALAIAEKVAARGYDPKVQRLLAMAHHRIGYLAEGDQANAAGGLDHYRQSQELLEALQRNAPGNPDDSPLLITVYGHLGDAVLLRGRADEAAAFWQKALDAAEVWFAKNPSDASKLVLGNSYRRASRGAQLNGVLDKAQEHARRAIEIHEALAAAQPSSTSRQRELLNSYERLAFVAGDPDGLNLGDLATAFAYNSKVVAIATSLAEVDPNNRMARSDLIIARLSNCNLVPDDDPLRVLKECQASIDLDPQNIYAGVHEGVAPRLGLALYRLGKRAEAVQTIQNAIKLLNESSTRMPWRVDLQRSLVRIHMRFGGILLEMKEWDRAIGMYRTGIAIGQEAVPKHPRDLVLRRDLADLYTALGRCYESFDARQSAEWYRKDLEIWSEWPRVATSTNFDQGRRAVALRNIARINP